MLIQLIFTGLWSIKFVTGGGSLQKLGVISGDHSACPLCDLIFHPHDLKLSDVGQSSDLEKCPISNFKETEVASTSEYCVHPEALFDQFINGLKQLDYFTNQICMIESWKRNQKEVISLYVDSKEISILFSELKKQLKQNKGPEEYLLAKKLLKKTQRNLSALKHLRLLTLGNFNPKIQNSKFSNMILSYHNKSQVSESIQASKLNVFDLNSSESNQDFGQPFLEELKRLMANKSIRKYFVELEHKNLFKKVIFWKYAFKTIDFLLVNKFISEEAVRRLFHDEEIVKQVNIYTSACFLHEISSSLIGSPFDFTEHWYWDSLNVSFKALTKDERKIIKFSFLLWNISHISSKIPELEHMNDWEIFKVSLLEENQYIRKIKSRKGILNNQKNQNNSRLDHLAVFEEDCEKIMNVLVILMQYNLEHHKINNPKLRDLTFLVCELLDSIANEFSPDSIKRNSEEKPERFVNFEDQFKLVLLYSRIKEVKETLTKFLQFIQNGNLSPHYSHLERRKIHETYYTRLLEDLTQFKDVYCRVEKRNDHLSEWLKYQVSMGYLAHGDQAWLKKLVK
ncbi:hypothetical protein PGT21_011399 [Puccinia graminis f. sp. tritici]|uniref:Uncharacterized protein n=1 Tax=Puccinia graminis f. sp. tritici TaxID=56615 RepID=A0A5B0PJ60_PUCGR|nr:hypothetical protein PGTUg99_033797 [Puccinia graminis f. sp. tritici]KAA1101211.1 hypothetical protein PGT21_011399 [Puccinia graminis f. sp. tritici]